MFYSRSNATPVTVVDRANLGLARYLSDGEKWGGSLGASVVLSYSFPGATASFESPYGDYLNAGEWTQYSTLSVLERAAVRAGLDCFAAVANIHFQEVPDTLATVGELRFASTAFDSENEAAHAYLPSNDASAGDVWFSTSNFNTSAAGTITKGSDDFHTIIHEIGHALGLKHTFDAPNPLPYALDHYLWSIMSYSTRPGTYGYASFLPTTLMYYDIVAIQALYGRNMSHNAGDTTYKYTGGQHYFETIDDAGGHDRVIYAGNLATTIDLRDGQVSTLSAPIDLTDRLTRATVVIGPNTVIEEAWGGSGNDSLRGNAAANVLSGRGGDDKLFGGAGDDTLLGGRGHDKFYFNCGISGVSNVDTIVAFAHNIDEIMLSRAVFQIARGQLSTSVFFEGAHAHDGNDRIVYDKANGTLYYDADGNGAAAQIEFASVRPGTILSAADFIVY